MDHVIDMSTSMDINPLKGLEDPSLYVEFDQWFAGDMTVDRRVQHSRSFFQVILGHASMGWLGDEVIFFLISFSVVDLCIIFFPFKSTCFCSSTAYSQVLSLDYQKAKAVSQCLSSACHTYKHIFFG